MKKWRNIAMCLLAALVLAGCGGSKSGGSANGTGPKKTVEQTVQEQIAQQDAQNQDTDGENAGQEAAAPVAAGSAAAPVAAGSADSDSQGVSAQQDQAAKGQSGIDVDLTALSSTMVYSEVYNMMTTPENYIGKTVKMTGSFSVYHDEAQDLNYYACIIQDATACCSQGMEFVLTDKYTYPDDYPEEGRDVTVIGTFDTYKEGEYTYCTLRNAELVN